MVPEHVGGYHRHPAFFHLTYLSVPLPSGDAGVVYLAHHWTDATPVDNQAVLVPRHFRNACCPKACQPQQGYDSCQCQSAHHPSSFLVMQRYTKFSNFPNVFVYFSLRSQLSTLNCQLSIVNWQLSIKNCHRPSRASDSTNLYKPNSSCEPSYSSRTSELYSSIININTLKDIVVPHGDNASP